MRDQYSCLIKTITIVETNNIIGSGSFTAMLYMLQYGHCELPHTSHMLRRYVGSASNIVSLKRSEIENNEKNITIESDIR